MSLVEPHGTHRTRASVQPAPSPNAHLSRDQLDVEYGNADGKLARWLSLAALRGDGPPMVKISARMVRYRRVDFEAWLAARTVRSTSERPLGEAA